METPGLVFLGFIAFTSLAEAAVLLFLAWTGLRLYRRLSVVQDALGREMQGTVDNVKRIVRNAGEVSDLAVQQARRLDDLAAGATGKFQDITARVTGVAVPALAQAATLLAAIKGIKTGLRVYRAFRRFV